MLKKILAVMAMLFAVASWAAVDANRASDAELDAIRGVGPSLSKRIIDERKKGGDFNAQSFGGTAAAAKVAKAEPKKDKAEGTAKKADAKP